MQKHHNSLIFIILICFLAKINAQNTYADSIFKSIKAQPYNLLFPYIFDEKFYDINNLSLISKNDKPFVGLQLGMTQRETDEKAARLKYLECTQTDKARIEAQKIAEEKFKQTTKTN